MVSINQYVNVDPALAQDEKLPILRGTDYPVVRSCAAITVYRRTSSLPHDVRTIAVNGAIACVDFGLCRKVRSKPDGDWAYVDSAPFATHEEWKAIVGMYSTANQVKARTLILATKANFWTMNRHTGTGEVRDNVRKVIEQQIMDPPSPEIIRVAYMMGHWASTLYILSLGGIQGLRSTLPLSYRAPALMAVSDHWKLRFDSFPAGTHKLAVAYAAARCLMKTEFVRLCPNPEHFSALPAIRTVVDSAKAKYHISAMYLTGSARTGYSDDKHDSVLGRLGTFIVVLFGKSTLARSPHFARDKVKTYDDYDPQFENHLRSVKLLPRTQKLAAIQSIGAGITDEKLAALRAVFLVPAADHCRKRPQFDPAEQQGPSTSRDPSIPQDRHRQHKRHQSFQPRTTRRVLRPLHPMPQQLTTIHSVGANISDEELTVLRGVFLVPAADHRQERPQFDPAAQQGSSTNFSRSTHASRLS